VLEAASVVGDTFDLAVVAEAAELTRRCRDRVAAPCEPSVRAASAAAPRTTGVLRGSRSSTLFRDAPV
jgi:hypothetical protein